MLIIIIIIIIIIMIIMIIIIIIIVIFKIKNKLKQLVIKCFFISAICHGQWYFTSNVLQKL